MHMLTRLPLATVLAASPLLALAEDGFLYAIKITPKGGKPYFLVRADGSEGNFIRSDQPDMLIPAWEIFKW